MKTKCKICGYEIDSRSTQEVCTVRSGNPDMMVQGSNYTKCQMTRDKDAQRDKDRKGLNTKPVPVIKVSGSKSKRRCLRCEKKFKSKHKFNRVCEPCSSLNQRDVPIFKGSAVLTEHHGVLYGDYERWN